MLGCPHMVWIAPCMFGSACMLGCLLCLDAPCMLGHPNMFNAPICLDDVGMPPVHTQHKESMLCQMKGVSICPIHVDAPCTQTTQRKCLDTPCTYTTLGKHALSDEGGVHMPPYIQMHPYVWMPHCMFGHCQMYGGIQRYEGHPNYGGVQKCSASKHMGHPNVWGHMDTPSV